MKHTELSNLTTHFSSAIKYVISFVFLFHVYNIFAIGVDQFAMMLGIPPLVAMAVAIIEMVGGIGLALSAWMKNYKMLGYSSLMLLPMALLSIFFIGWTDFNHEMQMPMNIILSLLLGKMAINVIDKPKEET